MTPFAGAGLTHPNDAFMLRRARFGQWTPLLVLVCASAAAVLAETLVPEDMERYWLALAGDWTLAHGRILEALQGSWYPARPWVDQEWLVAVATAWMRAHGLYALLELLFAGSLIFGICFVAFETIRTRTHPLVACAQVAVSGLGAVFFAQDRAQTLVWILLPALILAWRRVPWATVPLVALWANVHGSFPVAILWMLLHLDRRRIAPLIVAALATLANPLGWRLWAFTVVLARNAKLAGYVNEWTPAFLSVTGALVTVAALAPFWLRLLAGLRLRRPVKYGDLLFVAASAVGTLVAVRYSMLLVLTSATTLGDAFRTRARPLPFATVATSMTFSALILALAARSFATVPVVADPWFRNLERGVVFGACAPLVRDRRVFSDTLEVGNLVEMAGGTANVDGRIDAFPRRAIVDSATVLTDRPNAERIADRSGAQMLIIKGTFQPSPHRWRFEQRCYNVRLYARKGVRRFPRRRSLLTQFTRSG